MATIHDVAKRAGVSTYTVSAVLNQSAFVSAELTKRVREAVAELDYTVNELARGLQSRKTRTVGMLIPDIANPFYAKVVRGVEDILREAGYSLILGNTYNKPEEQLRYCSVFRSRQVDGLLLFVAPGESPEVRRMVDAKKPVVFVGRAPGDYEADTVTADNVLGTRIATEHLIAKGHRRIALITGHASITANVERVRGWHRAFRRAGLKADPRWACDGDWSAQSGACDGGTPHGDFRGELPDAHRRAARGAGERPALPGGRRDHELG